MLDRALARLRLARHGWDHEGVNGYVRDSGSIHAVRTDEHNRPVLICNTGIGGWDPARVQPTAEPVTCGSCRRLPTTSDTGGAGSAETPAHGAARQEAIPLDPHELDTAGRERDDTR